VLVAAVLLAAGGCGYALAGRGNTLPADLRTIGVPDLVNESTEAEIDRVLTGALRTEFQGRGRYVVQPQAAGVDAVLTGRVSSVRLEPMAFTPDGQAQRYQVVVTAAVEFKDLKRNQVLWSNPSFIAREEYSLTTGTTANDPAALFRQDANALERLGRNFARSVVTSILEAF
jgi:outer membrane lipopolysaccharide assembly protein LptE/RlpB